MLHHGYKRLVDTMKVHLTEYAVMKYPEGMEGWRLYRIEYWEDQNPFASHEAAIWLPPGLIPDEVEDLINNHLKLTGESDD